MRQHFFKMIPLAKMEKLHYILLETGADLVKSWRIQNKPVTSHKSSVGSVKKALLVTNSSYQRHTESSKILKVIEISTLPLLLIENRPCLEVVVA